MTDAEGHAAEGSAEVAGLTGALYQQLRDRIVKHQIRPGERLDPRWLSDVYKVSAPPVREALNRLTGEGLVRHIPSKGYFVRPITVAAMVEAYEMVFVLLRHSVEFGTRTFDPDGLQRAPRLTERLRETNVVEQEVASELGAFIESLFERIATMAGNSTVVAVTRYFLDQTHYARSRDLLDASYLSDVVRKIERLSENLEAGDREAALAVMKELIDEKRDRLPRLVDEIELTALQMDPLFQMRSDEN